MDSFSQKGGGKRKISEVKTFPVPFTLRENQENITITSNTLSKHSKEQIYNQAFKYHLQGNIKEAEKYYQYSIKQGFNDHRVFSNYGIILKDLDNLKEAELSFRKAIQINPNFAEAHNNLGNILSDLGKLKDAETSTRKAIEIKPDFAEAHNNLGGILSDLGKLKDAETSTRKAIEIKPDFANSHYNLGNILNDLGNLKEAELSFCKAIQINPDFAEAYNNLGNILSDIGKLKDAEISTRKAIEIKPDFADAHSNLGNILKRLSKLKAAEISTRKAIEIKPDFAEAHHNLGDILNNLGRLQEAELSCLKAIEVNPNYVKAYHSLSLLKYSDKNLRWSEQLFSESILNKKSNKDKIFIYFARANILHKDKNYKESSLYLQLANKLKLEINPSHPNRLLNYSKALLIESNKKEINKKELKTSSESIFIVGMPRSGSTLLESILSMSNEVYDLGETNILEESYLEYKKSKQDLNLAELYWKKLNNKTELKITTNKWLYNYQYAGVIAQHIPNAKIIHCFRNPLDNILSIFRAHFARGNEYASSLVDCTRVYLDQEEIMCKYKNIFRAKIYDLNYDSLVSNPNQEIKSIITWLGWKWDDIYLSPHLNPRSVLTASSVQVRSQIHSKSIGVWKNYKEMLRPAIEILTLTDKYQNITS